MGVGRYYRCENPCYRMATFKRVQHVLKKSRNNKCCEGTCHTACDTGKWVKRPGPQVHSPVVLQVYETRGATGEGA